MPYFTTLIAFLWLLWGQLLSGQSLTATPSGKYAGPLTVNISGAGSGDSIFYTLDGRVPDTSGSLYQSPFQLDSTRVLRAQIFQNGWPVGPEIKRTWVISANHHFPVVSLIFEPASFFDTLSGIYTNYNQDWEAQAWFEFLENEIDSVVLSQPVRVEIQGGASTVQAQKSLQIKPLSGEWLNWPVFDTRPYNRYKRLVLRNSGQDWMVTQFRDAMVASLADDISPFDEHLQEPDLDLQASRPSVVYLNGQYWGIYNIRERMNEHYVEQHYDIDADDFDLVENYATAANGDSTAWFDLFTWALTHSCAVDSNFQYLKSQINYSNFLDYSVLNVITDNQDWPGNNNRRWREKPGGQWRWLCYDLDFTFGLAQPATGGWNTGDPSPNALARLLDSTNINLPNPDWATLFFRRFWEQPSFRYDFANRTADWLNTIFKKEQVVARIDAFEMLYAPEISHHYLRWWFGIYDEIWRQNVEKMRYFADKRPAFVQSHIRNVFPEKNSLLHLEFAVDPPGASAGSIQVNTLHWGDAFLPWTGQYFAGIPVPVKAIPEPGWVFKHWSTPQFFTGDSLLWIPEGGNYTITAVFEQEDTSGINTIQDEQWQVYPNPAHDKIWIKKAVASPGNKVPFTVSHILGGTIKTGMAGPGILELDCKNWPSGTYLVQLAGATIKVEKM